MGGLFSDSSLPTVLRGTMGMTPAETLHVASLQRYVKRLLRSGENDTWRDDYRQILVDFLYSFTDISFLFL
jgi:hypothetical protein